jgi:hypothetical protein
MPRLVHVGFVVDRVVMGQVFSGFFSFPLGLLVAIFQSHILTLDLNYNKAPVLCNL